MINNLSSYKQLSFCGVAAQNVDFYWKKHEKKTEKKLKIFLDDIVFDSEHLFVSCVIMLKKIKKCAKIAISHLSAT